MKNFLYWRIILYNQKVISVKSRGKKVSSGISKIKPGNNLKMKANMRVNKSGVQRRINNSGDGDCGTNRII